MRRSLPILSVLSLVGMASTLPAYASSLDALREVLKERARPSLIQIQNPETQGDVIKPGAVLVLQADGVSATKLRVTQINTKSPRFHVQDYAPVEIAPDDRLTAGPGQMTLAHASERQNGSDDLRRALEERYRPSGIETSDVTRLGQVTRMGKLLLLAADAVPAKPFGVTQVDRRSRAGT